MARRYRGNMNGERYCANASSKEIHDLDNEQDSCQIDEIIGSGDALAFYTLAAAHAAGYADSCSWCLRACNHTSHDPRT